MSDVEQGKAPAVLSYFLVGIIWWLLDEKVKNNSFVKFHVKQAIVILGISILVSVIGAVLMWIPVIGWFAWLVLRLGVLVIWVMGLLKAIQGKNEKVPLAGQFVDSLKF